MAEAQEDICRYLTPRTCRLLYDLVVDVDGNLMVCCGDKISLPIPITEVNAIEELPQLRLQHPFCRNCFDIGYTGYFRVRDSKRAYTESGATNDGPQGEADASLARLN